MKTEVQGWCPKITKLRPKGREVILGGGEGQQGADKKGTYMENLGEKTQKLQKAKQRFTKAFGKERESKQNEEEQV